MIGDASVELAPIPSSDWRATLRAGYITLIAVFGILGSWSAVARIDAGVIAPGAIEVQSNRKTVQHLEGGIVSELLVRDGDIVKEGALLLRLDPTRTQANDDLLRKQQAISLALEARLIAQRDVSEKIAFPSQVLQKSKDPVIAASINDNTRQFEARRHVFRSATDVYESQVVQAEKDLAQAQSDKSTAQKQLVTVNAELAVLRDLLARQLVSIPRVSAMERTQEQLLGIVAKADIDYARSQEKISELRARLRQLRQEYTQEAATLLPDVRKALSDVEQQSLVAQDALRRIDVFAPVAGMVQQLRIFTLGGVIKPGDPILDIAPTSDNLVVRARVSPIDVDRVHPGQAAEIRLPQFVRFQNQVIRGTVRSISRDSIIDANNRAYFGMEATVDRATVPKEINSRLSAGMVVDVIVPTEERTVLEFLAAPVLNRLAVSMRER